MAAPLSQDLRKRLVGEVEQGSSARQAAARFAVSASAAIKLVRRVRETGSTEPGKIGGHRKPLLAGHEALLRELTATRKGITLAEIRDALIERGIQPGSLTTIWWTLRRLGLTHKKALHAAEQERPDVAEHRRFWRVWQRYMDAASFVFIDERPGPAPAWCDTTAGIRAGNAWSMPRRMGIGTPRPLWRGFAPLVLLPRSSLMDR